MAAILTNYLQINKEDSVPRIKLLVGFLVALVILSGLSAPTVSAQALDGVWLKVKVNVKGYSVDSMGVYTKSNGGGPGYLHFVWNKDHYDIAVWSIIEGGWTNSYNTTANTTSPGENFISDFRLQFFGDVWTDYLYTAHTPFITIKNGKVTYKGTGEIFGGTVGGNDFYGYFNISGTSVTQDKLPFTPTP
jgi:hypothetical protein